MPKPPYERFANSSEFGIYLPVESVKSFFKEYKKDIREQELSLIHISEPTRPY